MELVSALWLAKDCVDTSNKKFIEFTRKELLVPINDIANFGIVN